jgi:hypothetical protein
MNLDSIGISTVKDSTAFKKIQFFSKTNPTNLFSIKSDFQNSFHKLNNFYSTDLSFNESYSYGLDRQHTHTSLSSSLPMSSTLVDHKGLDKFFSYNLNREWEFSKKNSLNLNRLNTEPRKSLSIEGLVSDINAVTLNTFKSMSTAVDFSLFLKVPNISNILSSESDSKQYSNVLKYTLNSKHKKKTIHNLTYSLNNLVSLNTNTLPLDLTNSFSNHTQTPENTLKFKDYKSSNAQFLGSERTPRLLTNLNSNSYK